MSNKLEKVKQMYEKGLISEEKYRAKMKELGAPETPAKEEQPVSQNDSVLNKEEEKILKIMPEHMRDNISDGKATNTVVNEPHQYGGIDFEVPDVDVEAIERKYRESVAGEVARQNKERNRVLEDALEATKKIDIREAQEEAASGQKKNASIEFLRKQGFKGV